MKYYTLAYSYGKHATLSVISIRVKFLMENLIDFRFEFLTGLISTNDFKVTNKENTKTFKTLFYFVPLENTYYL